MSYQEKLKDPRWQKKRLQILERDHWRCKNCYRDDLTLHVHHLFYYFRNLEPWQINNGFLITLCEECHAPFIIDDIGILLNIIWKSGYGTQDLSDFTMAISKTERPVGVAIDCEFKSKIWEPPKK